MGEDMFTQHTNTAAFAAVVGVTLSAAGVCDYSTSLAAVRALAGCSQTGDAHGCGSVASLLLVPFIDPN